VYTGSIPVGASLSAGGQTVNAGAALPRLRNRLSLLLVLLGAVALLGGALAAYTRLGLLDEETFADRAVEALEGEGVRRAIEQELVGALPAQATQRQRRLIDSVTDEVMRSSVFREVFREATVELHSAFFARDDDEAALRLDGAIPLVEEALPSDAPRLERFARQLDAEILKLRRSTPEGDAVAVAEVARVLGVVLPLVACALFLVAFALAGQRRRALVWIGTTMAAVGVLIAASVPLARAIALDRVQATSALSAEQLRSAAGELYDAFVGGLLVWGLVLALMGALIAVAALTIGAPRRAALG
jgi:hypothetical protein